ncbi:MAG: hypothetical protein NUV82_02825 [Candidatus Komeilibacteria bacterium]|nr:hypothetical protein [Candidatus Komeilibacteria bacterium]
MSVILVLTHTRDDCASMVMDHLNNMGIESVRFDTDQFQKSIKLDMSLKENGSVTGVYRFETHSLNFEDIGVVWNRRIHEPDLGNQFDSNPDIKDLILTESTWAMNLSFTMIKSTIVNPWEINEKLKFNKWVQMQRAAEMGFKIPISCLTSSSDMIKDFWDLTGKEMIFKKIRKGLLIKKDGKRILIHTSKIPESSFNDETISRMRFYPMFLQKHINKKFDLRSVVVGNKVFTVVIHSQDIDIGKVDYRTAAVLGKLDEMKHEVVNLGEEINNRLVDYVQSFGLSFGVVDSIITPDDEFIFLEINPNGQWAWLEHKTGLNISQAFAEHLSNLNK